jgi:hypothetical protein
MRVTGPAAGDGISIVLGDLVALGDQPPGDLALGQALTEVGELERVRHGGRLPSARPTDPRAGGDDEHPKTGAHAPQRDCLLAPVERRRLVTRNVTGLQRAPGVPDPDRIRVELVLRLGDERERQAGVERGVEHGVFAKGNAGDRHDEHPWISGTHGLAGGRVAEVVAGAVA